MHILQGDLILHKRTLEPIKTVIYGLRRYDVDRVIALRETPDPAVKVAGYMSHKAKIYLVRLSVCISSGGWTLMVHTIYAYLAPSSSFH